MCDSFGAGRKQGSSHIRINKLTDNKKTKIYACKLNADERIEEIARMIGGIELTEKNKGICQRNALFEELGKTKNYSLPFSFT